MTKHSVQQLRQCLGRFATGVTVVTCINDLGRPCGTTANSFSSVSLDPPLVLWSIAKVSNSLEAYLNAAHFVINVLAEHQHELSTHFARSDHTLFDNIEYIPNGKGIPLIPEALARMECRTHAVHDCGDHYIIIGEIESYDFESGPPLLFYAGSYTAVGRPA